MECEICSKDEKSHDDFFCATCARSFVYLSRLELARVLIESEQLGQQVSNIVGVGDLTKATDSAARQAQSVWQDERLNAERLVTKGRIEQTRSYVTSLKSDIEQLRSEIAQRKESVATKKKALDVISQNIPARRRTSISTMSEMRDKGLTSFSNIANRSANTRAFLCRETATLLRLRQKKRQKNGAISDQCSITGLSLPDLKEINNMRCTDLTASLTSTAHLLVLVAFYLGVRLPAEICVPHRNYPLPTINTPAHSYLGRKIAFPGSGSISTAPSSPFSSKHDVKDPYRPRPLFVGSDDREEKVAQFAKRDPIAFNFFVEGISLLAWDIAWLCRTQGFSQGTTSWEDVCDIGRNLYQLIFSQPQSPALLRVMSERDAQKRRRSSSGTSTPVVLDANVLTFAKLGQASHLSANAFLGQASFNEQSRSWKYNKYNLIADGLKKLLVTEMNNAEWELVQEQEWDDGGEQFKDDEAIVIKARATDGRVYDEARSVVGTIKTAVVAATTAAAASDGQAAYQSASEREQGAKPKGTSGWTKVKSRSDA